MQVAANNAYTPVVNYGGKEMIIYGEYDFYVLNINGLTIYAVHSIPASDTDLYYSTSLKDVVKHILRHYAEEEEIRKHYNVSVDELMRCIEQGQCSVSITGD